MLSSKPERLQEAIASYQQSIEVYRQVLPHDHLIIASGLNNEGMAWLQLNDVAKAATLLEQSLLIRRKKLTSNHWMMVTGPLNVARVKARLGEHQKACTLIQESLGNAKLALASEDPTWGRVAHGAALVSYQNQDWAHVMAFADHALRVFARHSGTESRTLDELRRWRSDAKTQLSSVSPRSAYFSCRLVWTGPNSSSQIRHLTASNLR